MMSGMRKAPPISISSPRETITCFPNARVFRASSTAAALLLTTVALSAPVSSQLHPRPVRRGPRARPRQGRIPDSPPSACQGCDRVHRFVGQQGSPEVGVHHRPGEIEHAAQARVACALRRYASSASIHCSPAGQVESGVAPPGWPAASLPATHESRRSLRCDRTRREAAAGTATEQPVYRGQGGDPGAAPRERKERTVTMMLRIEDRCSLRRPRQEQ